MFRTKSIWPAIALVVGLQSAALAWMVRDRISLITSGTEVVLAITPVDPRDLFRGDYVILNPEIARITTDQAPVGIKRNDEIYVVLQKAPNGTWSYISLSKTHPTDLAENRIAVRARVQSLWNNRGGAQTTLRLRYGIEKYFVPEGTGKELEKKVRERQIRAIVAVGSDGEAAIKGLEISGKRMIDPPLF